MLQAERDQTIARYLLGTGSDLEWNWVEEQMLADEDFLEQCLRVEDQLIDDFVLGHLEKQERALVEKKFRSSPRWSEKHKLAEFLREYSSQAEVRVSVPEAPSAGLWGTTWAMLGRPAILRSALLAAALLMIATAAMWWIKAQGLRAELAAQHERELIQLQSVAKANEQHTHTTIELERASTENVELRQQLRTLSAALPAITLLPAGLRGEAFRPKEVVVWPGMGSVHFELFLDPDANYREYRAKLQRSHLTSAFTIGALRRQKSDAWQLLIAEVDAHILTTGNYLLRVEGKDTGGTFESIPHGTYYFHVTRK